MDAPLKGQLVLSALAAASVAILNAPTGWIPGGAIESRGGLLYVPSAVQAPTATSAGYALPASLDLAGLEADIVAAMTDGITISVDGLPTGTSADPCS